MQGKKDAQKLRIECRLHWKHQGTLKNQSPWRGWVGVGVGGSRVAEENPSSDSLS